MREVRVGSDRMVVELVKVVVEGRQEYRIFIGGRKWLKIGGELKEK